MLKFWGSTFFSFFFVENANVILCLFDCNSEFLLGRHVNSTEEIKVPLAVDSHTIQWLARNKYRQDWPQNEALLTANSNRPNRCAYALYKSTSKTAVKCKLFQFTAKYFYRKKTFKQLLGHSVFKKLNAKKIYIFIFFLYMLNRRVKLLS